jgi:hypothetical protein
MSKASVETLSANATRVLLDIYNDLFRFDHLGNDHGQHIGRREFAMNPIKIDIFREINNLLDRSSIASLLQRHDSFFEGRSHSLTTNDETILT